MRWQRFSAQTHQLVCRVSCTSDLFFPSGDHLMMSHKNIYFDTLAGSIDRINKRIHKVSHCLGYHSHVSSAEKLILSRAQTKIWQLLLLLPFVDAEWKQMDEVFIHCSDEVVINSLLACFLVVMMHCLVAEQFSTKFNHRRLNPIDSEA